MNNKKGGVSPEWRTSETAVGVRGGGPAQGSASPASGSGAGYCFLEPQVLHPENSSSPVCGSRESLPCSEPALQPRRRRRGRPALAGRAAASFPPSRRRRGNGRLQLPPAAGWTALLAVFFLPVVLPVRSSAALCNPCFSEWKPCFHI